MGLLYFRKQCRIPRTIGYTEHCNQNAISCDNTGFSPADHINWLGCIIASEVRNLNICFNALHWLSNNLAFSFVIGMFYGVFILDYVHSAKLISRLKAFAIENNVILRYDEIKVQIRNHHERTKQKYHFFFPFYSERPLGEHLKEMLANIEMRKHKKA